MRVVVVGATGNIGTAVVDALRGEPEVDSIVGVARRGPGELPPGVEFHRADIRTDDLVAAFRGADAVVHLAWLFQPTHRPADTWDNNVIGAERVLAAASAAGVRTLVCASSVAAYSPARDDEPVRETWPTDGWPLAAYPREKAYVERVLDAFERAHLEMRVVRMRPSFVFQRSSASQQRRLFAGPLVPNALVRPGLPILPVPKGLRFQAVHSADAGRAFAHAVVLPCAVRSTWPRRRCSTAIGWPNCSAPARWTCPRGWCAGRCRWAGGCGWCPRHPGCSTPSCACRSWTPPARTTN